MWWIAILAGKSDEFWSDLNGFEGDVFTEAMIKDRRGTNRTQRPIVLNLFRGKHDKGYPPWMTVTKARAKNSLD